MAVGQLLEAEAAQARLVIIGGAALNLLGIVKRATRDVDVVAMADMHDRRLLTPSDRPFAPTLLRAIAEVGRDFGLPEGWMNAGPDYHHSLNRVVQHVEHTLDHPR